MANNEETAALFSPRPTFDVGTEQQFIKDYNRDNLKKSFDKLNSKKDSAVSSETPNISGSVVGKSRPIISNSQSKFGLIFDSINDAKQTAKQKFNTNTTINTLTESPFIKTVSEGINTTKQTIKSIPSMFKSNYENLTDTVSTQKPKQTFKPKINQNSTQQTQYSNKIPTKKEVGIFANELKSMIKSNVITPAKQKASVKFNQIKSSVSSKDKNQTTKPNSTKTFKGTVASGMSKLGSAVKQSSSFANDLGHAAFSPNLMSAYNILSGKTLSNNHTGSHVKDVDDSETGLSPSASLQKNISGGNAGTVLSGGNLGSEDTQQTSVGGSDKTAISVLNKIYQVLSMTHNKINKISEDTSWMARNSKSQQTHENLDYADRLARLNEIGENYRASQSTNAPHHEHHEHEEDNEDNENDSTSYDIDISSKNKKTKTQKRKRIKGQKGVRNRPGKSTKGSGIVSGIKKFAKGTGEVIGETFDGLGGGKSVSALGKLVSGAGVVAAGSEALDKFQEGDYAGAGLDAIGAGVSYVNPVAGGIMAAGSVVGEGMDWLNKKAHSAIFGEKPEKNSFDEHQQEYQKYKKLEEESQKELTDFTSKNSLQNTDKKDLWGDPIKGYNDPEKQKQYEEIQEKLKTAKHKKDIVTQHAKKTFDEINPQDEDLEKQGKAIDALKKRGYSDTTLQSLGQTDKNYIEVDGKKYPAAVSGLYDKVIERELSGNNSTQETSLTTGATARLPKQLNNTGGFTETSIPLPQKKDEPSKESYSGTLIADTPVIPGQDLSEKQMAMIGIAKSMNPDKKYDPQIEEQYAKQKKATKKESITQEKPTGTSTPEETAVQQIPSATPVALSLPSKNLTATPVVTPMLEGAVHADDESQNANITPMLEGAVHADEYDTTKSESTSYDTVTIETLDVKELKIDTLYSPQPQAAGIFGGGQASEGGGFFGSIKKALGFGGEEGGAPTATKAGKGEGKPIEMPADKVFGIAGKFESGNDAGKISSGAGDAGGKSYGQFQLSSKTGDVNKFLKGSGYEEQFKGLEVGSKEFDAKWQDLAKNDDKFSQAQKEHAKKTHFDPQMRKLEEAGMDLSERGDTVKAAIFSTANQYGANTSTITKALSGKDVSKMSDEEIVNSIQDYKQANVSKNFKSSNENVQAGVSKRIEQERKLLNAQLAEEKKSKELMPGQQPSTELAKTEENAQAVALAAEQKPSAALVKEQKSQEPLLAAALKTPPVVGEKPEPKPIQTAMAPQTAPAAAPQGTQKSKDSSGFGNKLMKVRNDDPLILTLQYGNIRTV